MFPQKYITGLIKRSNLKFPMLIEHKTGYYDQDKIRYYAFSIQELFQICYDILNAAVFASNFCNDEVPDSIDEYADKCEPWQKTEYYYSVEVAKLADKGMLTEDNSYVYAARQSIKNMKDDHEKAQEDRRTYEIVVEILRDNNGPQAFAAVCDFMSPVITMSPIKVVDVDPEVVKDWA